MAVGRRGLDSGRENAGASSRRLEEVEGEVRGPWAREIEEEEDGEEKENTAAGKDKAGDGGYR